MQNTFLRVQIVCKIGAACAKIYTRARRASWRSGGSALSLETRQIMSGFFRLVANDLLLQAICNSKLVAIREACAGWQVASAGSKLYGVQKTPRLLTFLLNLLKNVMSVSIC